MPKNKGKMLQSGAMYSLALKTRIGILLLYNIPFIVLDQWTKAWAVSSLKGKMPESYLGGFLKLLYAENTGAWGNLGSDWGPFFRSAFLLYLPVALMVGLVIYSIASKKIRAYEVHAYSLILSGGIGNLIDRFSQNYVVDFLWVGTSKIGTNIFNIADMVIMAGFIMLIWDQIAIPLYRKSKGLDNE